MKVIVAEGPCWVEPLEQVKRMRPWVRDAEHLLDGSWANPGACGSHEQVGRRFDRWRQTLARCLSDTQWSPVEHECFEPLLQVRSTLRPDRIQCYDRKAVPRTNHELERSIRGRKTPYRRISGRKNCNTDRLR